VLAVVVLFAVPGIFLDMAVGPMLWPESSGLHRMLCHSLKLETCMAKPASFLRDRQVNEVNGGDTVFVVVCLSVCLFAHSGPINQTSLKLLKLRTSNLMYMFPGTART